MSPELKEFLDYVAGAERPQPSEFISKIKGAVHHAKQNREWRRERMIMYFRDQDIRTETRNEMILSMLDNNVEREVIKKVASVTDEEIDKILENRKSNTSD